MENSHKVNPGPGAIGWGFLGGLVGTLVMDLLLMGILLAFRQSAWLCFVIVGNTVSSFLAKYGILVASGIPTGAVAHYVIGPLVGILFGSAAMILPSFRGGSLKRFTTAAIIYVQVVSLPLLAASAALLNMETSAIFQWFGGAFFMHMILSIVLGAVVWYGLRTSPSSVAPNQRQAHLRCLTGAGN